MQFGAQYGAVEPERRPADGRPAAGFAHQASAVRLFAMLAIGAVAWSQLLGDLFGPIAYRHRAHVARIMPPINQLEQYREYYFEGHPLHKPRT